MGVTGITELAYSDSGVADYGDQALMVQCDTTDAVLAWAQAVREAELSGVVDIVPASRTVLVKLRGPSFQEPTRQSLRKLPVTFEESGSADQDDQRPEVVIDVVYDGPDLAAVADHTGLTVAGVISAHSSTRWRVAFAGFAPGFGYLIGGDQRLRVPRRAEPRTAVPAGSVALAGEFSAVYPRQSPGGWQLIGHTDAVLWDIDRPDPALLTSGVWVQFRSAPGTP